MLSIMEIILDYLIKTTIEMNKSLSCNTKTLIKHKNLLLSPRPISNISKKLPRSPLLSSNKESKTISICTSLSPIISASRKETINLRFPKSYREGSRVTIDVQTSDDEKTFGQVLYPSISKISIRKFTKKRVLFKHLEIKNYNYFDSSEITYPNNDTLKKEHLCKYFKKKLIL